MRRADSPNAENQASRTSQVGAASAFDFVSAALADAAGSETVLVVSVPAPSVPVESLLGVHDAPSAVLFAPPEGIAISGSGSLYELTASGNERFASVRREADRLFERLIQASPPGTSAPSPRLVGGFSFQCGRAESSTWRDFGEARFVLPRFSYLRDGRAAWLSLAVSGAELFDRAARRSFRDQFFSVMSGLERRQVVSFPEPPGVERRHAVRKPDAGAPAFWDEAVRVIVAKIARGECEKVVLARAVSLELSPAPNPADVLARLSAIAPECTRFAFRRGARTFLGATPERLVQKLGLAVETEALAGSRRASPNEARRLLESPKDRAEQALVVRALLDALGPLGQLEPPAETPEVCVLRDVVHLRTRVALSLRDPLHVLELVERLHPTPAVGGVPTELALEWIAENERFERGWYASPVGWFSPDGDGRFEVALRSAMLQGRSAELFVGAGIVADSDAASELMETELKLLGLLSALGAAP